MVRLRSSDTVKSTQAKFLVHTMQIVPQKFCKTYDTQKILPVSSEQETVHHFRVEVDFRTNFFCLFLKTILFYIFHSIFNIYHNIVC